MAPGSLSSKPCAPLLAALSTPKSGLGSLGSGSAGQPLLTPQSSVCGVLPLFGASGFSLKCLGGCFAVPVPRGPWLGGA